MALTASIIRISPKATFLIKNQFPYLQKIKTEGNLYHFENVSVALISILNRFGIQVFKIVVDKRYRINLLA
jgi:hypothetical protein